LKNDAVCRRAILKIHLSQIAEFNGGTLVYLAGHVIDDLVIDDEGRFIYWTAYDAGCIARLDVTKQGATHDVIVQTLTSPRALVIDSTRGLVAAVQLRSCLILTQLI
jgi:hypothetical protein